MNWMDYRDKLGIGLSDKEKLAIFETRIANIIEQTFGEEEYKITKQELFNLCNTVGFPFSNISSFSPFYLYHVKYVLIMFNKTLKEYISCLCALVNSIQNYSPLKTKVKNTIKESLDQCNLEYEVYDKNNDFFIYPLGVKYFDEKLIDNILDWLVAYPNTLKIYKIALEQYSNKTFIRDVADNLRKALEVFFQEFFINSKNLDNNIPIVGAYLKEQNADEELRNMLVTLIKSFKVQNDKIAKHNDRVDEKFLEFLLYQTGVFIRMLMVVKNNENKED